MSQMIIGKCSLCGGRVILETVQWVSGPPLPARCERCGASEDQTANLPTIPMKPTVLAREQLAAGESERAVYGEATP